MDSLSIFDLNVPQTSKSFKSDDMLFTTGLFGKKERECDLYEGKDLNILIFGFSYEKSGDQVFIRFKAGHKYETRYKPDVYYEVNGSGKSSCGDQVQMGLCIPWEIIVQDAQLIRNGADVCFYRGSFDSSFLKLNKNGMQKELDLGYIALPEEVRVFEYLIENPATGEILCTDIPAYFYGKRILRVIDSASQVHVCEILSFNRFRDGGTTDIRFKDDQGGEHLLHYPNRMGDKSIQIPTVDGTSFSKVPKESDAAKKVATLLGLVLKPTREPYTF